MRSNKKNPGWILCPSRSVMGKYYYFNVQTGEAVWSLSEDQTRTVRLQNITDRSHTYPEPRGPYEECPNISNYSNLNIIKPNMGKRNPNFGQVIAPQYLGNFQSCPTPVIWAPVPMVFPFGNSDENRHGFEDYQQNKFTVDNSDSNRFVFGGCETNKNTLRNSDRNKSVFGNFEKSRKIFGNSENISNNLRENNKGIPEISDMSRIVFENNEKNNTMSLSKRFTLVNLERNIQNLGKPEKNRNIFRNSEDISNNLRDFEYNENIPGKCDININDDFEDNEKNKIMLMSKRFTLLNLEKNMQQLREPKENRNSFENPDKISSNLRNFGNNRDIPGNDMNRIVFEDNDQNETMKLSKRFTLLNLERNVENLRESKTKMNVFGCRDMKDFDNSEKNKVVFKNSTHFVTHENFSKKYDLNFYQSKEDVPIVKESKLIMPMTNSENTFNDNKKIEISTQTKVHTDSLTEDTEEFGELNRKCEEGNDKLKELDKNDLRHVLLRRKKLVEEKDKPKNLETTPKKKKVTFDIDKGDKFYFFNEEQVDYDPLPSTSLMRDLKMAKVTCNKQWYLMVDLDVLLSDVDVIMTYIYKDEDCKLLLPYTLLKNIELLAKGEHGGRSGVIVARRAYRRLTSCEKVQIVVSDEETTLTDQMISCCLQNINKNCHVVLVSNNTEVHEKAKNYGIHVYSIEDIKNDQEDINDKRELKLTVVKPNTTQDNFLQGANVVKPSILSFDVNFKQRNTKLSSIFDDIEENNKNDRFDIKNKNNLNNSIDDSSLNTDVGNLNIHDINVAKKLGFDRNNTDYQDIVQTQRGFKPKLKPLVFQKIELNTDNNNSFDNSEEFSNFRIQTFNRGQFENFSIQNNAAIDKTRQKIVDDYDKRNFKFEDRSSTDKIGTANWAADNVDCVIEDELKRFYTNNRAIEITIIIRKEEWFCCYRQIMEELVNTLLEKNIIVREHLPCFLHEGLQGLKLLCSDANILKTVDKLLTLWNGFKQGINDTEIKANDFMKMIGCGFLLVEAFKSIMPEVTEEVGEIGDLLRELLYNIKNPMYAELEQVQTPVQRCLDDCQPSFRCNYIKRRSDIVDYLKKHFAQWKNYREMEQHDSWTSEKITPEAHIVRTLGKNLSSVKFTNRKRITFDNYTKNKKNETYIEKDKGEHTFDNNVNLVGPKIVRKMAFLKELEESTKKFSSFNEIASVFEEKTKRVPDFNEISHEFEKRTGREPNFNNTSNVFGSRAKEIPDFSEASNEFEDGVNEIQDIKVASVDENDLPHFNDTLNLSSNSGSDDFGPPNDDLVRNDGSDDFDIDVSNTCSFLRLFLRELSSSFIKIHSFLVACSKALQRGGASASESKRYVDKARETHEQMSSVINHLKSIIERESGNSKLKSIIIKAGEEVAQDTRLTRYRQTITKCLEQAHILDSCLKLVIKTIEPNDNISISTINDNYFNIFE